MATASEECSSINVYSEGNAEVAPDIELFRADTVPWLGVFTVSMLEDQLGLEWDDESGKHATESILIVNQGDGGEAGLVISLLARRDFGIGRVVVAIPSTNFTVEAVATTRAMGATDVIVLQHDGDGKSLKTQLEEIGVTEVTYTMLCYSSQKYAGPYKAGSSDDGDLGATDGTSGRLPTLVELDSFLRRSTSVWNSMARGERCIDDFDHDDPPGRLLEMMAKSYPDDDYWPLSLNQTSGELELKSVILAQRVGMEHCLMQIVVGSRGRLKPQRG